MVLGLELAARYAPAETGGVGGDWYDVFSLPSNWLCVVIGDVVGRGLDAADTMVRRRSALRAYALLGDDPAEVLDRLDQEVQHFDPRRWPPCCWPCSSPRWNECIRPWLVILPQCWRYLGNPRPP